MVHFSLRVMANCDTETQIEMRDGTVELFPGHALVARGERVLDGGVHVPVGVSVAVGVRYHGGLVPHVVIRAEAEPHPRTDEGSKIRTLCVIHSVVMFCFLFDRRFGYTTNKATQ